MVVLQFFFEALWTQETAIPLRGRMLGVTLVTPGTRMAFAGDLRLSVSFVSHNDAFV